MQHIPPPNLGSMITIDSLEALVTVPGGHPQGYFPHRFAQPMDQMYQIHQSCVASLRDIMSNNLGRMSAMTEVEDLIMQSIDQLQRLDLLGLTRHGSRMVSFRSRLIASLTEALPKIARKCHWLITSFLGLNPNPSVSRSDSSLRMKGSLSGNTWLGSRRSRHCGSPRTSRVYVMPGKYL